MHAVETMADYAQYFHLAEVEITAGCASRISIVHHDSEGGIVGVEITDGLKTHA